MDISTLQEYVRVQADDEDGDIGLRLLTAKLGQMAEFSIGVEDADLSEEDVAEAYGDLLGGLMVIVAHTAMEQGVDLNHAVAERISHMQKRMSKQEEMEEAMENLNFEKIANELGLLEDDDGDEEQDDDESDDRAFADSGDTDRMFY